MEGGARPCSRLPQGERGLIRPYNPFKGTSSVAMNPIIKFTTLFGQLAVELAISLPARTSHWLAALFFFVSIVFVYRFFYGMRIGSVR